MDIREYARKRDDLRAELCGRVAGAVDSLSTKCCESSSKIFIMTILAADDEYRAAVAKLDAEYESQKAGVTA